MKKIFACSMMFVALCAIPVMAATTTLTGVITDDMCGNTHTMLAGKPDADCVRECVKSGAKFAVVANGKLVLLTGKSSELSALAGKKATLSGELKGDTLTVTSVVAAK